MQHGGVFYRRGPLRKPSCEVGILGNDGGLYVGNGARYHVIHRVEVFASTRLLRLAQRIPFRAQEIGHSQHEVMVDVGIPLSVLIPKEQFKNFSLGPGEAVCLTCPPESVEFL